MSSARQAVHRADNLIGFGKRPDLTPSHQLVLPRGITVNTCANRKNPVSGISCILKALSVVSGTQAKLGDGRGSCGVIRPELYFRSGRRWKWPRVSPLFKLY